MSMSLIVGEFNKTTEEQIDAEYNELCKTVYLTEYMDEIITEYLDDLKVIEKINDSDTEEVIYKTVLVSNIEKLANKIDSLTALYFEKYDMTKGKGEKEDIVNHLKNLFDLNFILRETLFFCMNNKEESKIVALIIA